ncbi:hypothetical protein [Sphingomonas jaspsi]|uniref:hypothetical protein n=1 Tax=Sphingomonas jaspsi TaxID=392409 RepID=UPI0004B5AF52|nr:hypothetical protein [Sphingomonas jaspsi]
MKKVPVTVAVLALGACTPKQVIVEKPVVTYVEKPVACPSKEERARLKALRPTPLREQDMPASAVERNAKAQAQLGRYEAEGGWADQVDSALDRCQVQ